MTHDRILRVAAVLAVANSLGQGLLRLDEEPAGRDSWRQTDGLMVGRNFCVDETPIWEPRIHARGAGSGITGMEFPILNCVAGRAACTGRDGSPAREEPVPDVAALAAAVRDGGNPYDVFIEARKSLPLIPAGQQDDLPVVLLEALDGIEEDVGEHDTSNFNVYFDQTEEEEPTYDELHDYRTHYRSLKRTLTSGGELLHANLHARFRPEDAEEYEVVEKETAVRREALRALGYQGDEGVVSR